MDLYSEINNSAPGLVNSFPFKKIDELGAFLAKEAED